MAGSFCRYCDQRCFVERVIPGPHETGTLLAVTGGHLHMATCRLGMEHDRKVTGYDYTTATNPRAAGGGS